MSGRRTAVVTDEVLRWQVLPGAGKPMVDLPVLLELYCAAKGTGMVVSGWWSGQHWIEDASGDRIERERFWRVVAWATMPQGPGGMARQQEASCRAAAR